MMMLTEDVMFDFLHMEIVDYVYNNSGKDDDSVGVAGRGLSRLESLGFRVGQSLVERVTHDSTRFKNELDTMKFICKEFWTTLYRKQVDNLRTNHHGVYVLQDNNFKFLTQISNGKQFIEDAPKYLAFPCGLIRGALSNLGVNSIVTVEVNFKFKSSVCDAGGIHCLKDDDGTMNCCKFLSQPSSNVEWISELWCINNKLQREGKLKDQTIANEPLNYGE